MYNDVDGYKTIMPDVLVGTHRGFSGVYGPPTNKVASWSGMALCYVQRVGGKWQYVAEWVVHDEVAAARQLGRVSALDKKEEATGELTHDCQPNLPSWGWMPPKRPSMPAEIGGGASSDSETDGQALATERKSVASGFPTPAAKAVVQAMDALISDHVNTYDWQSWSKLMRPFWADDFVYDSTLGTGMSVGLRDWFFGEHVIWNDAFSPVRFTQLIFAGDATRATTTTYATATWRGEFAGVRPSGLTHRIRISDFYLMGPDAAKDGTLTIQKNWMMLDVADLVEHQAGVLLTRPCCPTTAHSSRRSQMTASPRPSQRLRAQHKERRRGPLSSDCLPSSGTHLLRLPASSASSASLTSELGASRALCMSR